MKPADVGTTQTFVLAAIAFVGLFAYVLMVTALGRPPDPVIFPALVGIVSIAGSYFFGAHIANGAASKALDALVQTSRDRTEAIAAAMTSPPAPPAANP